MHGGKKLSRRQFGVLAASPLLAGSLAGPRPEPRREAPPGKARPFPLQQVRLLSGTCYTLQDRNRVYLHTGQYQSEADLAADIKRYTQ